MTEIEQYINNLEKINKNDDLIISKLKELISKQKELISILKRDLDSSDQIINLLVTRLSKYEPNILKELAE